ncbi:hypothetical protein M5689_022744 [Euphorbia peplus]|nr:hypothetical protein M5689_022744 [Euphorbia peplus]
MRSLFPHHHNEAVKVFDSRGEKSISIVPAKFQKSLRVKQGSFVVDNESWKEKSLQSGSKVFRIVLQVLFYKQVHALKKSPE